MTVMATRHRVERFSQDQKSELGLDHFESRTNRGQLLHFMLTCAIFLFLMRDAQRRRADTWA